jgi:2-polyprenyl-3-methyl-5-hydroxy-6-metoxy-1,4-benzoquinol methylase
MRMKYESTRKIKVHYDSCCRICGDHLPEKSIGEVREHEYQTEVEQNFTVKQCPGCSLVFLWPRPDTSELAAIYPKDYYAYNLILKAIENDSAEVSFTEKVFYWLNSRHYQKRLVGHINAQSDRPLRILDVGCGVGAHLDMLKSIFPGAETFGVEMNSNAATKARTRGHHVFEGRFEDVDIPPASFDLVTSYHVIEHVAKPDFFLKKCLAIARDQGAILLETPNTDCIDFKIFKKRHWGGYHAPRHWYLFQRKTLGLLSRKLDAAIVASGPASSSVFWVWTLHSVVTDWLGKRIADMLFPPVTIFFGGFYSFFLLSVFAGLERILGLFTRNENSLWVVIKKLN